MKASLRGIIPPVITPLIDNTTIDEEGLCRLLDHMIKGGVHGLFLLGTTGEATSLSYKLREKFVNLASRYVNNRVPIIVGITDTSFEDSLTMAHCFKEAGAAAAVIAPPYYIPISQSEMRQYLENLVPKLPLPFFLYNMPAYTKLHMTAETVNCAKQLGALGIKDSSGDLLYLYMLIDKFKDSPDFSIFTGTEIFIPETISYGGHGAVSGGANFFPELYVDLYNASMAGDKERVALLQQIVMQIYNTIYNVGKHSSKYTLGTKCALSVLNICNDFAAQPLRKFDDEQRSKIYQYICEIKEQMALIL